MNILSYILHDFMRKRGGTCLNFVQIGAHDGRHLDPIYPFVKKYHWAGLLVEPQPAIFKQLKANYADEKQLSFEQCALYEVTGNLLLHAFKQGDHHDHSTMLTSVMQEAIKNNTHGYNPDQGVEIVVPCLTLIDLLAKHQITAFDFLQVDVEGYDHKIIEMLAQTKIRPAIINFESGFYGMQQLAEIYFMLGQAGYEMIQNGIDTICYLNGEDDFSRIEYEGLNFEGRKI